MSWDAIPAAASLLLDGGGGGGGGGDVDFVAPSRALVIRRPSDTHRRARTVVPPTQPVVVGPLPGWLPIRVGTMPWRDPARYPHGRVVQPPRVIADAVTPPAGASGSSTFAIDVEDGAMITYEWPSVVRKAWSGKETRASLARVPRQRFQFASLLGDSQMREVLETLAEAASAPTFLLGLAHEELGVVSSTSSAITVASLALCDWAVAGQRIVVVGRDGTTTIDTWITGAPSGGSIPVGDDVSAVALEGARIMPAVAVKLEAEQGLERRRTGVMRWDLLARAIQNGFGATTTWGTGAAVTTHDDMPVWDRGNVIDAAAQPLVSDVSQIDGGLAIDAIEQREQPDWMRAVRFETSDEAEWQWFKAFLMAVRGRSTAFLLSTGRPDLVAVGDAHGTVTVDGDAYANVWAASVAHRRLRITRDTGEVIYRTVTSSEDNGDGTSELTLSGAIYGGIDQIEFLETVRLDSDEVSVRWAGYSFESSLTARVVQQTMPATDTPADEEPSLRIVALIGQSNTNGKADTDDISDATRQAELETAYAAVQLKQQRAATAADPIVWVTYATDDLQPRSDSATENFGVELSLGQYLDRAVPNGWGIVKMGVGSSGLADHWDDDSLYPANSPPNLFTQAVEFLQDAEAELGGTIAAIVWIQGESDALDSADAAAYEVNLTEFIAALRDHWPGVPFVFNKLHNSIDAVFTEKATVRAAQVAVAAAVSGTTLVDLDDLTLKADNTHFSADMNVEAGDRFGEAVLGLLGINVPPVAAFSSSASGREITFTDESTDDDGTIASWSWNFGDGNTSTQQNPIHTYSSNGVYTVTLTVTDSDGDTDQVQHDVTAVEATWDTDGPDGWAVPSSDAQWDALISDNALSNWSAPLDGVLCQEASGNLVGYNGTITLIPNNAPLYQQTKTGWTGTLVGTTDATANQRFRSQQAALPDVSTTSMLVLALVAVENNPAAARGVLGIGAGGIEFRAAPSGGSSALARATAGSTVTSGTEMGTLVEPVWLQINATGGEARLNNDHEELAPNVGSPTGKLLDLGATIGASPATIRCRALWVWSGADAERTAQDKRDLLEAMGITVTGYGS